MNEEGEGGFPELLASPFGSYRLPRELANLVLLRLVDEDEERPIRLAEAETGEDGGTLDDLRGEMEPWPVASGFSLLMAPVVTDFGCRRPFKARNLSPCVIPRSFST